jgi:hypothetical protein
MPFDTLHSAAQHAWKQQDEGHEDLESLDDAIEEIVVNRKSPDGEPYEDGSANGIPDGSVNGTADGTTTEPSEAVSTDGGDTGLGLSGPPAPTGDPEPAPADSHEDDEPETLDCPKCGADTGETADWFDEDKRWRCEECRTIWRGSP